MEHTTEQDGPIMPNDGRAATPHTFLGWKSRTGKIFLTEKSAREDGATHVKCQTEGCTTPARKGWLRCDNCRSVRERESYKAMPFVKWDMKTPVYDQMSDKYFFTDGDILDHLNEMEEDTEEVYTANDLRLILCEPVFLHQLDLSTILPDEAPEDFDDKDVKPELIAAMNEVNRLICAEGPIGWKVGKKRTIYIDYID